MSLAPITLTTDKSTAVIDNAHRRLRQDENGLSITVAVLNEDNTAYDLTGKNLVFCENKQNSKIIIDNGKGDNSGKFNRNSDNDTKGVFTYVLQEDAYAASGRAWFEIDDGTTVDSTKNFYFDVEKDASISIANNDYIGSLKALETAMAGAQSKVTNDLANMETQITQKIATLQSQWNSELQSVKNKANTDTDAAVKAINDRYANDFTKIKSDFTSWQTSTIQNYQKQVDGILAQVQKNGTEVADVQKQVNDTIAKMQDLTKQFGKIDFTIFAHNSQLLNYYTKAELDPMLAKAGKVKTVNHVSPDDSGNIQIDTDGKVKTVNHVSPDGSGDITIPAGGVTSFNGKKGDITFKVVHDNYDSPQAAFDASKIEDGIHIYDPDNGPTSAVVDGETITVSKNHDAIVQLQQQVGSLQNAKPDLSGYETTAAVQTLADRITALENRKPIKASSQDDAVARSKNSNDEYYW